MIYGASLASTLHFERSAGLFNVSISGAGVELSPLLLRPFIALFYHPWMKNDDGFRAIIGMKEWQGETKY
jgi:hypothetical protein